jgi:hypothetical protein
MGRLMVDLSCRSGEGALVGRRAAGLPYLRNVTAGASGGRSRFWGAATMRPLTSTLPSDVSLRDVEALHLRW